MEELRGLRVRFGVEHPPVPGLLASREIIGSIAATNPSNAAVATITIGSRGDALQNRGNRAPRRSRKAPGQRLLTSPRGGRARIAPRRMTCALRDPIAAAR